MTPLDVYSKLDAMRPNLPVNSETVIEWIERTEIRVRREIYSESSELIVGADVGGNTELSVPEPYSDIYLLYALAMSEFYAGDYNEYNNTITKYAELFDAYAAYYIRNNKSKESAVKVW